jgi:protein ImuA
MSHDAPALPRPALRPAPLPGRLDLVRGRVHEFCGPARRTLALVAAAELGPGPVVWIAPPWADGRLHPEGVRPFLDPGRLVFVAPRRAEDLLWCLEETLRAGAVAAAVAELVEPPGLTAVRRLQLAAAAAAGGVAGGGPTGLLLTPGDGGAAGVETRWHLAPRHAGEAEVWQLERRRARAAPPAAWRVEADPAGKNGLRFAPLAGAE